MSMKKIAWLAPLFAVGLCVAGCGGETASAPEASVAAADHTESGEPEKLPLFNPCTEISVEDLEAAGLEEVVIWPEREKHSSDPEGHQCGWKTSQSSIDIASGWRPFSDLESSGNWIASEFGDGMTSNIHVILRPNESKINGCNFAIDSSRGLLVVALVEEPGTKRSDRRHSDYCELGTEMINHIASLAQGVQNE